MTDELCRWGTLSGECENGRIRKARHTVDGQPSCSYCLIIYNTEEDNETVFNETVFNDINGADLHREWGYTVLQNQDGKVVWVY